MYAIIKTGGKQYRVEQGSTITVEKLSLEEGATFETDQVLLVKDDSNNVTVGTPAVEGAKVTGKVVEHFKDKKIVVFKMKRRKGYRLKKGHRQNYTKIQIENIAI